MSSNTSDRHRSFFLLCFISLSSNMTGNHYQEDMVVIFTISSFLLHVYIIFHCAVIACYGYISPGYSIYRDNHVLVPCLVDVKDHEINKDKMFSKPFFLHKKYNTQQLQVSTAWKKTELYVI